MSPEPTCVVWTKFVGSPIMERSIRRRRFGCGCSAMQQLKQTQNSVILRQKKKPQQFPLSAQTSLCVFLFSLTRATNMHRKLMTDTGHWFLWGWTVGTRTVLPTQGSTHLFTWLRTRRKISVKCWLFKNQTSHYGSHRFVSAASGHFTKASIVNSWGLYLYMKELLIIKKNIIYFLSQFFWYSLTQRKCISWCD